MRELDRLAFVPRLQRAEVDRDMPQLQPLDFRTSAPENRVHARQQLLEVEGLGDVVVGAELEAENAIRLLAARRQHDDRRASPLPQEAAELEAALSRQHHVENDQI